MFTLVESHIGFYIFGFCYTYVLAGSTIRAELYKFATTCGGVSKCNFATDTADLVFTDLDPGLQGFD